MSDRLLTVTQAAALACVSRVRVYELIRRGVLTVAPESPDGMTLLRASEFETWRLARRPGRPKKADGNEKAAQTVNRLDKV